MDRTALPETVGFLVRPQMGAGTDENDLQKRCKSEDFGDSPLPRTTGGKNVGAKAGEVGLLRMMQRLDWSD